MPRTPMLDPKKLPVYMGLSAIAALAVGMIVHRFSGDLELSALTTLFLVISDYLALRWLLDEESDDKD